MAKPTLNIRNYLLVLLRAKAIKNLRFEELGEYGIVCTTTLVKRTSLYEVSNADVLYVDVIDDEISVSYCDKKQWHYSYIKLADPDCISLVLESVCKMSKYWENCNRIPIEP